MAPRVDAIRASFRILQAVNGTLVQPVDAWAVSRATHATSERARAGPRTIEAGASGQASGGATDGYRRAGARGSPPATGVPQPRERWARDIGVRAEEPVDVARDELLRLPSFKYSLGPDGRVHASGGPPELPSVAKQTAPTDTEVSHGPEPPPGPDPPRGDPQAHEHDALEATDVQSHRARDPTPPLTRAVQRAYAGLSAEPTAGAIDTVT